MCPGVLWGEMKALVMAKDRTFQMGERVGVLFSACEEKSNEERFSFRLIFLTERPFYLLELVFVEMDMNSIS